MSASGLPDGAAERVSRFPGFDVMDQSRHWDDVTRAVVVARTVEPPPMRFFTPAEEAAARALLADLLDLRDRPGEPLPDVIRIIDGRLAETQTDGWHYDSMPVDDQAWRDTLAALDADAREAGSDDFSSASEKQRHDLIARVQSADDRWHGMPARYVWSLWTRYAATAFYSHPEAWNEIGFSGPAYPRGYKNLGVDRREPFEVRDSRPHDDPAGRTR
ncbi:gluconate 2-dehydrogenase subunit 3 family protein [Pseudolysinimonas sp.]|uniref:gluconate 2-dehydrogenase subunit 3 family protein n=1 Tax=Pseudolysinimonas sp. TaxID=2680009 RepID=UPI003F7CE864